MYLLTVLTVTDLTWPDFISNKSATLVWHSFEWCVLAAVVSSNGWPLTPLWVGSRLLQQHAMQWVQCNASGVTQTVIDSKTGQKKKHWANSLASSDSSVTGAMRDAELATTATTVLKLIWDSWIQGGSCCCGGLFRCRTVTPSDTLGYIITYIDIICIHLGKLNQNI